MWGYLLSDVILFDDQVVTTPPVCRGKNFLSNLECTLWKTKTEKNLRNKYK